MNFLKFALFDFIAAVISIVGYFWVYYEYGEKAVNAVANNNIYLFSFFLLVVVTIIILKRRKKVAEINAEDNQSE